MRLEPKQFLIRHWYIRLYMQFHSPRCPVLRRFLNNLQLKYYIIYGTDDAPRKKIYNQQFFLYIESLQIIYFNIFLHTYFYDN